MLQCPLFISAIELQRFEKIFNYLFTILAVVYGVVIIGGAFVVKYFGTLVLQVYMK